jgi:hypothetical protein
MLGVVQVFVVGGCGASLLFKPELVTKEAHLHRVCFKPNFDRNEEAEGWGGGGERLEREGFFEGQSESVSEELEL